MFKHDIQVRVRYSETDRMGYAYYGNYAQYYEVARVEALRQLGISYKVLEDEGILLPVLDFTIKYLKPAFYDDLLKIQVTIPEMPTARIRFVYECWNEKGDLLNKGETTLVFIDKVKNKPCMMPPHVHSALKPYFDENKT
jgi:acyl-CoA thioester hydrolase